MFLHLARLAVTLLAVQPGSAMTSPGADSLNTIHCPGGSRNSVFSFSALITLPFITGAELHGHTDTASATTASAAPSGHRPGTVRDAAGSAGEQAAVLLFSLDALEGHWLSSSRCRPIGRQMTETDGQLSNVRAQPAAEQVSGVRGRPAVAVPWCHLTRRAPSKNKGKKNNSQDWGWHYFHKRHSSQWT